MDELLSDETLSVHATDIQRVREGHWLTVDGEFFEVVEISDKAERLQHQVKLKKIEGLPEDRSGFIGSFYRTGETLELEKGKG